MHVFMLHVGFEISLAFRNMRDYARKDPRIAQGVTFTLRELRTEEFAREGLRASTLIVAGGPEVMYQPERVLARWPALDLVATGEGEEIVRDLLLALLEGRRDDVAALAGLTVRMPDGRIVRNPERDPIARLDEIPSPYLDELERDASALHRFDGSLIYETVRGCVYHCAFCLYGKGFFKYRYYDEDRCVADLSRLLDRGFTVQVVDPIFGLNKNRTKRMLQRITEVERPGKLILESYAELVDDEVAALFKKAGVVQIGIGLQTVGQSAIVEMDRRFKRDRFIAGASALSRAGLDFYVDVIYGLPNDDYTTFLETIDFGLSFPDADLEIYRLLALPGTRYFDEAAQHGLRYSPEPPYETYGCTTFPYEDVMRAHKVAHTYKLLRHATGKVQRLAPIWKKHYGGRPSSFLTDLADYLESQKSADFFSASWAEEARFVIRSLLEDFLVERGIVTQGEPVNPT